MGQLMGPWLAQGLAEQYEGTAHGWLVAQRHLPKLFLKGARAGQGRHTENLGQLRATPGTRRAGSPFPLAPGL